MSTPVYAQLEIGLHRLEAATYQVELRFTDPDSEAEIPPARGTATFDPAELLILEGDPRAYGEALAESLFADAEVRALYGRARAVVEAGGRFLRLRLALAPSAAELHALRWELLRDPESKALLATSEKTPFSRFMVSRDWRPVHLRPKIELRALVAVAAPSNLAKYRLAEVDRAGESERARNALAGIEVAVLEAPVTAERLLEALRAGVDVLYLVCHGAVVRGVPRLYLQDSGGEVDVADGDALARRIAELPQAPRLAVLASCESAKTDGTVAETALAPRLAEAGVPAVLAMQGRISMETVEQLMPAFFAQLLKDGQIDRALAVARSVVRNRPDVWMPALFLRLKRGRIWYVPGFAGEGSDFAKWKSICRRVRQGRFIPILGPEVGEQVFGGSRELAERIAAANGFPLADHDRSDLARVAQYLSISQDRDHAQGEILKYLQRQTLERHRRSLGDDAADLSLPALFDAVLDRQRRRAGDPLRILAELEASVYITASPETLLFKSLQKADREPTLLACDWRPTADNHPEEPPYEGVPAAARPVVYHVFGVFGKPDSLVLTEDDYFDYLIAASAYQLMPAVVRGSLTESSLLFVGFRLDDWTFRLLFRLIMSMEGSAELRRYSHVGVQVDPEEHDLADVERAREYLDSYFGADRGAGRGSGEPRIDVYWGTTATFLDALRVQLVQTADRTARFEVPREDGGGWF